VNLGGTAVPTRLLDDNAALLEQFGVDVSDAPREGLVGYRPVRDPDGEGVRVELATDGGRRVVHNYGHGGAGITLSWGCALRVARILTEQVPADGRGTHGQFADWRGTDSGCCDSFGPGAKLSPVSAAETGEE